MRAPPHFEHECILSNTTALFQMWARHFRHNCIVLNKNPSFWTQPHVWHIVLNTTFFYRITNIKRRNRAYFFHQRWALSRQQDLWPIQHLGISCGTCLTCWTAASKIGKSHDSFKLRAIVNSNETPVRFASHKRNVFQRDKKTIKKQGNLDPEFWLYKSTVPSFTSRIMGYHGGSWTEPICNS